MAAQHLPRDLVKQWTVATCSNDEEQVNLSPDDKLRSQLKTLIGVILKVQKSTYTEGH